MNSSPDLLLINDGKHANSEYLAAIMTSPVDFSRGNLLTKASICNLFDNGCDPQSASILLDRDDEIKKALWPGFVTGQVFFYTLRGLSLERAQYLTLKILDGGNFKGELKQNMSRGTVRNYWRKYKTVSHLWASYTMFVENNEKPETNLLVQYAQKLREMCLANGGIKGCELLTVETDVGPFDGEILISPLSGDEKEKLKYFVPHTDREKGSKKS